MYMALLNSNLKHLKQLKMTTKDKMKSFQNELIKIFQRGYNQPKTYGQKL